MRLISLALALVATSVSWAAMANPAINSNVSGAIAGTVGTSVVATTAATQVVAGQVVAGQAQARLDGRIGANLSGGDVRSRSTSTSAGGMNDSIPRGWLMALVTVLLIGHQLRRKHRFLRPQRFSDI